MTIDAPILAVLITAVIAPALLLLWQWVMARGQAKGIAHKDLLLEVKTLWDRIDSLQAALQVTNQSYADLLLKHTRLQAEFAAQAIQICAMEGEIDALRLYQRSNEGPQA